MEPASIPRAEHLADRGDLVERVEGRRLLARDIPQAGRAGEYDAVAPGDGDAHAGEVATLDQFSEQLLDPCALFLAKCRRVDPDRFRGITSSASDSEAAGAQPRRSSAAEEGRHNR